jgi:succinyl-diaminopimelate desuccinylase
LTVEHFPGLREALPLAEALIARRSITPQDAGCQALIAARLAQAGFEVHHLPFGPTLADGSTGDASHRVDNLYAVHRGARPGPTLVFAGHTDVVPTGPIDRWASDPFVPTFRDGKLHGRGAADMKTSVAAMVVAAETFARAHPQHAGAVAVLFTSDEEGPAIDGTVRVCDWLGKRGEKLDLCIVGEPTSVNTLGDTIKNGRRGSLTGKLVVQGIQGHVAYPQLARNPVHQMAQALADLAGTTWDAGNAHFPPTSFQISNVHAGTGVGNVIPGEAVVDFNFRFSTESTPASLKQRVVDVLQGHGLTYQLTWLLGGEPFLTPPGTLSHALREAIAAECGVQAELSTTGGTSDGRFIAKMCEQVVEFGPINATIHKVDEHVLVADIPRLAAIYRRVLDQLLA